MHKRSIVTMLALLLAACGGGSGEAAAGKDKGAAGGKLVDACTLLKAADPAAVLGAAHDGGQMLWERDEGWIAGSQCQFTTTDGEHTLGLMIRRGRNIAAPASHEALVQQARDENLMGAGEDTAQALAAGKQVAGVGDFAVSYELFSHNLMFWKGNHELIVMLTGYPGGEAEQKARQVAQVVLGRI